MERSDRNRRSTLALERPSLLMKVPKLQSGLQRLFQELRTARARRNFIASPAEVITRLLPGVPISASGVSDANRLLFSVLANDRFRSWAASYQKRYVRMSRKNPNLRLDRSRIMGDLAEAFAKFGDKHIVAGLIAPGFTPVVGRRPKSFASISNFIHTATVLLVGGYAVIFVVLTAIDFTPYTERPDDARFALSPADMRAVADQLVARAKQLERAGVLMDPDASVG